MSHLHRIGFHRKFMSVTLTLFYISLKVADLELSSPDAGLRWWNLEKRGTWKSPRRSSRRRDTSQSGKKYSHAVLSVCVWLYGCSGEQNTVLTNNPICFNHHTVTFIGSCQKWNIILKHAQLLWSLHLQLFVLLTNVFDFLWLHHTHSLSQL